VIPNVEYYKRKNYDLKKIVAYAKDRGYTALMVMSEKSKVPDGLYICSLPEGPTSFWRITNVKLGSEMGYGTNCNESDNPELIINNFDTRLGRRTARQLASLFPSNPDFKGRRSVTFHNQRDFVFFRHYRYQFKGERDGRVAIKGGKGKIRRGKNPEAEENYEESEEEDAATSLLNEKEKAKAKRAKEKREKRLKDGKAHIDDLDCGMSDDGGMSENDSDMEAGNDSDASEDNTNYKDKSKKKNQEMKEAESKKELERAVLQEIGPRFTMKMRYLQHGTFDAKNGEYEYMWRPDSQVSKKKMFL